MRIRRFITGATATIASLVLLPGGLPAAADTTFDGVCVGSVQMTFANDIMLLSGPTSLTNLTGHATCRTDAEISPKSLDLTGFGTGVVTQCAAIVINGAFNASFDPTPAPPPSSGTFTYLGTTSGGALRLNGANPTLHALGVLVGGGAVSCAQGGSSIFTFQMILPFADP